MQAFMTFRLGVINAGDGEMMFAEASARMILKPGWVVITSA